MSGPLEHGRRSPVAITATVATATLALTLMVSVGAFKVAEDARQTRLDQRASNAVTAIDRRMQAYTESVLGGQALFSTGPVTRQQYRRYVTALELPTRYPGIQVLGHATHVTEAERATYDAGVIADAAATDDYPPFIPYAPGPQREPVDGNGEYLVIDYVEPTIGNEAAFGLDFFSEANRRAAATLTRDTGTPSATAPVVLVQETGSQSGFLVMRAIYDVDDPSTLTTDQGRRDAFAGVEYAAFRMGDLIAGVLGAVPDSQLELYDVGTPEDEQQPTRQNQTYSDAGDAHAVDGFDPSSARLVSYDIGGRRWKIFVEPVGAVGTLLERVGPWLLTLAGLLLTGFAAVGVWSVATARERATSLAEEMTQALRESQEELARSNQELERFAYVASHDLQEPLRTVSSFVSLLEMDHGDALDARARGYLDHVRDGAQRMSQLIAELLDYSRAGRDLQPRPLHLGEIVTGVVGDLRASIAEAGAEVQVGPMPTVMAEPTAMIQVFSNLLGNALKYRASDRLCRITITAEQVGVRWKMSVIDNGIGIAAKYHDEIFVMLRRLHGRSAYPGTGMGLAITKKHIEIAGGRIGVDSTPGAGARFWFTLPAAEDVAGVAGVDGVTDGAGVAGSADGQPDASSDDSSPSAASA